MLASEAKAIAQRYKPKYDIKKAIENQNKKDEELNKKIKKLVLSLYKEIKNDIEKAAKNGLMECKYDILHRVKRTEIEYKAYAQIMNILTEEGYYVFEIYDSVSIGLDKWETRDYKLLIRW